MTFTIDQQLIFTAILISVLVDVFIKPFIKPLKKEFRVGVTRLLLLGISLSLLYYTNREDYLKDSIITAVMSMVFYDISGYNILKNKIKERFGSDDTTINTDKWGGTMWILLEDKLLISESSIESIEIIEQMHKSNIYSLLVTTKSGKTKVIGKFYGEKEAKIALDTVRNAIGYIDFTDTFEYDYNILEPLSILPEVKREGNC